MRIRQSIRPLFFLVLANLVGMFAVLMHNDASDENIVRLCVIMCGFNILAYIAINFFKLGDGYLFIITSMLSSVGVIMQTRINSQGGIRQMKLYLAGACVFFSVMLIYKLLGKYFSKLAAGCFGLSVILFLATMIFGKVHYGAKNWIEVMGISVQPSEFIRILFVLTLAATFTMPCTPKEENPEKYKKDRMRNLLYSSAVAYINTGFLILQREWGIAVLFFVIYLSFLYIYGGSKRFLFINLLALAAGGFVGARFMSHIQTRISVWLNPLEDINGKGYQIMQSLFAIGAGGFAGSGIGGGSPYLIPIVSSDFIFSAICEEMGVLGGIAVVLLYFVLVYRGFKIALSCTNHFNKAVCMGISTMLGVQTFIIIGGVIKLIPLTGITLPFISYGGSSMITTFMALGILQAISAMKGEVTDEIE